MQQLEEPQRIELEYESLRNDNSFKKHPKGKSLFFQFRQNTGDIQVYDSISSKLGITRNALTMAADRLDEKSFTEDQIKAIRKKHIQQVSKTKEKIDKANQLLRDTGNAEAGKIPEGTTFDDMVQHLKDQLKITDKQDVDWQDILLRMHQILIMREWDVYEKTREAGLKVTDIRDKKDLLDISDKKVKQLLTMIQQNISEYGTLLSSAAADVMTDQEQQIDKMAKFVLKNNMDKLSEVVDLVESAG